MRKVVNTLVFEACFCIVFGLFLQGCRYGSQKKTNRKEFVYVNDMAGRRVPIPRKISKIASNGPSGAILLYAMAPDLLIARNFTASGEERKYFTSRYCNLPSIGTWFTTNGTRNTEAVIGLAPEVIFSVGNIGQAAIDATDSDQKLLKIPMFLVSSNLLKLDESFRLMGKILDREEKAKELTGFYQQYAPKILQNTARLDSVEKARVYVAMGDDGLYTVPGGSLHSQVIEMAGAVNVAHILMSDKKISANTRVSMEQVIKWNPDIILICNNSSNEVAILKEKIMNDDKWAGISAVRDGKLITVPSSPFLWVDRPPSINQLMGLIWLAGSLYPEDFSFNVEEVTKKFYDLFYHRKLTDKEANEVLTS